MRNFKLLKQEEQDEMLAETLLAQERDLYMHEINKERFLGIINSLPAENSFRQKLEREIPVIDSRIEEVSSIIDALEPQLPDNQRLTDAMTRIEARRANRTIQ
jgi:hypothetical protein